MPKSSKSFEIALQPDRRHRRWLDGAAAASVLAGLALIVTLPLPAALRSVLATGWVLTEWRSFDRRRRCERRAERIRLDAIDNIVAIGANGRSRHLALLPGSRVFARSAWLRLRFADGLEYVEWLPAGRMNTASWQRLRLITGLDRRIVGRRLGS